MDKKMTAINFPDPEKGYTGYLPDIRTEEEKLADLITQDYKPKKRTYMDHTGYNWYYDDSDILNTTGVWRSA